MNGMSGNKIIVAIIGVGMLAGCVSVPDGPSVMVMPGDGKNFPQFRSDDYECRDFAHYQIGGKTADQAAANSGIESAAVGTVMGAAAGAAINGGRGAGVGAGAGLVMGSLIGADAANASGRSLQHRYDIAYEQCMYTKGNKVPMAGNFARSPRRANYSTPYLPPPPPDSTPPPDYYPPPSR
jgi:hypothetical protein